MIELTRRQQQILDFILKWQRTAATTPTYQEIADQFGFRSLNSETEHLRLLRKKGFLASEPGRARSLRVTSPLAKLRGRLRYSASARSRGMSVSGVMKMLASFS
jgi:repressor LexA